jgi:magnesium-transporting ATPase (P-type)
MIAGNSTNEHTTERTDGPRNEPMPGRRRTRWHRVAVIATSSAAALSIATVLTALLLMAAPSLAHAQAWLDTARPWLLSAQLAMLALLWARWADVIRRVGCWRGWSPRAVEGVIGGRRRIFTMLAVCMLLLHLPRIVAA